MDNTTQEINQEKKLKNHFEKVIEENGKPKTIFIPLEMQDIVSEFLVMFGDDKVFVYRDDFLFSCVNRKIDFIKSKTALFSWVGTQGFSYNFKNTGSMVSKDEFFHGLLRTLKKYEVIAELPHWPTMPGVYYNTPYLTDKPTGALDGLLEFFNPLTKFDHDLIKTLFLTPFWGERGAKPAFFIEGPEDDQKGGRGIGKTSLMDAVAKLSGGYIDCEVDAKSESIKKRIINDSSMARVVRFDNVKTTCLSSAGIEGLITAPEISEHQMFSGNKNIANHYTYIFTINDNNLSKDLAQRAVRIKIKRVPYSNDWQDRLDDFIDKNRVSIISDIILMLKKDTVNSNEPIRFGAWQKGVLSKVNPTVGLPRLINERQNEADMEIDHGAEIEAYFSEKLSEYMHQVGTSTTRGDTSKYTYLIKTTVAAIWYKELFGIRHMSQFAITGAIKRAQKTYISNELVKRNDGRYWHMKKPSDNWNGGWLVTSTNFKMLEFSKFRTSKENVIFLNE